MKKFILPVLLVSLTLSLAGCDKGDPEAPAPAPVPVITSAPANPVPNPAATVPSIDEQMDDLRENNGDVSQEDKEHIDNVPVIPDVFGS